MSNSKGIEYIVNSSKAYPPWLKNHSVFKEMSKIDKVFPRIGLPNFKEPCDIINSAEAMAEAGKLSNKLIYLMSSAIVALYSILDIALCSKEKDRNDKCAKIQYCINTTNSVIRSLQAQKHIKIEDGKVVMKLNSDIFCGDKNPSFRKNEAVLRVCGKLWDLIKESGYDKIPKIDQLPEFKDFSRVNIPNKKYIIAFSSYGEEGAWDIGTISMRGVTSCQSWNAPQSRGLIGSISSKFVGVIYISSDQEVPGYGTKMLNRSMVRFCINKNTKKPALVIDNIYPNSNADTINAFKKVLSEKTGLDVLYTGERPAELANYYIPDEPSRKYLRQGEFSYMDYAIPIQTHKSSFKRNDPVVLGKITNTFKSNVCNDIDNMIKAKRELYVSAKKTLEGLLKEFDEAKAKWEKENEGKPENERAPFDLEKPKMDADISAFGKGGVINLLNHCDKKHGAGKAGTAFTKIILDSIEVDYDCASPQEYHRKYLMAFLKNQSAIKEKAKVKINAGTWAKSFPKSSEKFFDMIFSQMKGYFLAGCKELIKKAN